MEKLIIHSQDYLRFVSQDEIVFCKSDNSYTFIHLADGEKLLISRSLTQFSRELNTLIFIRANQSYLINKNYIRSIDKKKKLIELVDKSKLPFTTTIKELLIKIASQP